MHCGRIASRYNKDPDARTVAPSALRAQRTDLHGRRRAWWSSTRRRSSRPRASRRSSASTPSRRAPHSSPASTGSSCMPPPVTCRCSFSVHRHQPAPRCLRRHASQAAALHRGVLETLREVWGPQSVGLRICPGNRFNDLHDEDPVATYETLLRTVAPMNSPTCTSSAHRTPRSMPSRWPRRASAGRGSSTMALTLPRAVRRSPAAAAAAVSYARAFIANPDLVRRFASGWPLAHFDRKTLYTPGAEGYTSYPPYAGPGSIRTSRRWRRPTRRSSASRDRR